MFFLVDNVFKQYVFICKFNLWILFWPVGDMYCVSNTWRMLAKGAHPFLFCKWYSDQFQRNDNICFSVFVVTKYGFLGEIYIWFFAPIFHIIKWSGILANFAYSWLTETCFPRPYLRVRTPQMLNDSLSGVSMMPQLKRRFTLRFLFA